MIIVIGHAITAPQAHDMMLQLSLEHVARSRDEPGCMAHTVHVDCEDASRLVFVEYWSDMSALQAHFAVSASRKFAGKMRDLSPLPIQIEIFDALDKTPA